MAVKVVVDSKLSYTAACNSVETLVVDEEALDGVFVSVAEALIQKGVELRCDSLSKQALSASLQPVELDKVKDAKEDDYNTEFLDLILAIKTIPRQSSTQKAANLAISHINEHSSHHTDGILTSDEAIAEQFLAGIDSAGVFWNTSTRMADGQRFGFGTEVGISTNKIHARGPVGLEGLTIYRWLLRGQGQVSLDYGSAGKAWKHERLAVGEDERTAATEEEFAMLKQFRARKTQANGW